jgi:small GTP-binding protein
MLIEKARPMEETYLFKIVIGGQGAVGKTTLLHRYLNGVFLQNSSMTIGVAFHAKQLYLEGVQKKVKLSLWDLGGQERFRFLQANYSAGAKAAVVFFDMTRPDSEKAKASRAKQSNAGTAGVGGQRQGCPRARAKVRKR